MVVAAQAFHWFEPSAALPEIARVLFDEAHGEALQAAIRGVEGVRIEGVSDRMDAEISVLEADAGGLAAGKRAMVVLAKEEVEPELVGDLTPGLPGGVVIGLQESLTQGSE